MKKIIFTIFCKLCLISLFACPAWADISSNLQMELTFNNTLTDATGNGNNGTGVGSPTYTTGNLCTNALNLTASQYVYVNNTIANYTTNAFTVACWMNAANYSNSKTIYYSGQNSTNGFYFFLEGTDIEEVSNQSGASQNVKKNQVPTTSAWIHVGFTSSGGASPTVAIYYNGSSIGSGTVTAPSSSSDNFQLNSYNSSAQQATKLQDCRIYNRALSAQDMTDLYNYAGCGQSTVTNVTTNVNQAVINNAVIN